MSGLSPQKLARLKRFWTKEFEMYLIENCEPRFKVECPKHWDSLTPTDDEAVRFCETCRKNVFLCRRDREVVEHGREGHCVALTILAEIDRIPRPRLGLTYNIEVSHERDDDSSPSPTGPNATADPGRRPKGAV
jgi:hypothetical protein